MHRRPRPLPHSRPLPPRQPTVSRSPSVELVADEPEPEPKSVLTPETVLDTPSPSNSEVLQEEMTLLEAEASSFILDDMTELDGGGPHTSAGSTVANDPVMAMLALGNHTNPFADDYML
jgi:hypothetical protein